MSPLPPRVDRSKDRQSRKIKNLGAMRGKLTRSVDRLPQKMNHNDPRVRLSEVPLREVSLSPTPFSPLLGQSPTYSSKCNVFFPIELAKNSDSLSSLSELEPDNSKERFVSLKRLNITLI